MNKQPLIQQILQGMQNSVCPSDYWLTWVAFSTEFPELESTLFTTQQDGQSVFAHTMSVIDLLSIKNPITLLSGLFHDLGKSYVLPMNDLSLPRFPGHALASANISKVKLTEWQASSYLIDRVFRLVSMHMYDISNAAREKTIRKFVADVGQDNVENWFALRIADSCCYAAQRKYRNHIIKPFKTAVMLYLKQQPGVDQPKFSNSGKSGAIQIKGEMPREC